MPSERLAKCFADILVAIRLIRDWVDAAGGTDKAVHHNVLVRSAIERQLLLISEAAIRMDKLDAPAAPRLAPSVDWPGVRGIGNFIRHKYDDLDAQVIADVIDNRLGPLEEACRQALQALADRS